MFERFTEQARRVIFFARYEATMLGADTITPDHIFLGLVREDHEMVRRLDCHVVEELRGQAISATGGVPRKLPLSQSAKQVLFATAEESEALGHRHIGTEHLLLGLFKEGSSRAAQLLQARGVTLDQLRQELTGRVEPTILDKIAAPASKPTKTQIRKAVFPAAGLGTRFLPATKAQPKEMLPVVDKPLIQYAVEEAISSGIEQIIVVTGRGKNAIEDHFDIAFELEQTLEERGKREQLEEVRRIAEITRFAYVRQKKALGLGHAVLIARDLVNDEPFAVLLGDDLVDSEVPCLKQMVDVFNRYQAPVIAIMEIDGPDISKFGAIRAEQVEPNVYRILDMVEKPEFDKAPSNLAIIGRYILTPDIFDELEATPPGAGGEIQLTDAMRSLLKKREVYGYRFNGKRYDAGDKLGFLIATVELALKRDDIGQQFREYLENRR
jgi:UTP--glucose-1-phosphate uridylyltransferase